MAAQRFSESYLDDIRRRVPVSSVVGRDVEWDRRKSRPGRGDLWACCPFHSEGTASFHVEDGKGRFHCFGCKASGDVFSYATDRLGMRFPDAVQWLAGLAGLGPEVEANADPEAQRKAEAHRQAMEREKAARRVQEERRIERRQSTAAGIWEFAVPIAGTPAEAYLWSRGIRMAEWSPEMRYHPRVEWELGAGKDDQGRYAPGPIHPALVCRVTNAAGAMTGLWRIFIKPDGSGKADLEPNKVGMGPCKGGSIRLAPPTAAGEIGVCEGVETALAVMILNDGKVPVWPLMSSSFMPDFEPPFEVAKVRCFQDGDIPKRKDGRWMPAAGPKACQDLKARMAAIGLPFVVEPAPRRGMDYLDILNRLQRNGFSTALTPPSYIAAGHKK